MVKYRAREIDRSDDAAPHTTTVSQSDKNVRSIITFCKYFLIENLPDVF